jgi:hypothetical protein
LPAIHGRRESLCPQQELRLGPVLEHGELPHPEALRQPPPRDPAPGRRESRQQTRRSLLIRLASGAASRGGFS